MEPNNPCSSCWTKSWTWVSGQGKSVTRHPMSSSRRASWSCIVYCWLFLVVRDSPLLLSTNLSPSSCQCCKFISNLWAGNYRLASMRAMSFHLFMWERVCGRKMQKNSACVDQTCSSSMQSELGADSSKREARRDGRRDGGNKWSVALVRQQCHIVPTGHYLRCMLPAIGGSRTDRVWTTDIRSGCGQPDRHGSSRVEPVAQQKKKRAQHPC